MMDRSRLTELKSEYLGYDASMKVGRVLGTLKIGELHQLFFAAFDDRNATIIERVKAELAVAIRQSSPSDDQIIMDHIHQAYRLLSALDRHYHVAGTTVGKDIDECALCGRDIREDVHFRMKERNK